MHVALTYLSAINDEDTRMYQQYVLVNSQVALSTTTLHSLDFERTHALESVIANCAYLADFLRIDSEDAANESELCVEHQRLAVRELREESVHKGVSRNEPHSRHKDRGDRKGGKGSEERKLWRQIRFQQNKCLADAVPRKEVYCRREL